ncbi:hypothetical protein [Streptomyces sp. SID3343]|uniref:hypothetical protein n=1 Tax=Streptomyces sp. SID3343 TaxID=2690260 RepID=UPI0013699B3E|nr:hypothetical protein [Streptomyces sp. SID3343]MYV98529.1 hypothetical protein [Streptomyces sp. SID3343]
MLPSAGSCAICDRQLFPVPMWVGMVPPLWNVLATWKSAPSFFSGELHFSCLRTWPHRRNLRAELIDVLTTESHSIAITVPDIDDPYIVHRRSFGFEHMMHDGQTCQIFGAAHTRALLVIENDGPWFFLSDSQRTAVENGDEWQSEPVVEEVFLREPIAGDISGMNFGQVVDAAGVGDFYGGPDGWRSIDYEFLAFDVEKRILTYSVATGTGLPQEAAHIIGEWKS